MTSHVDLQHLQSNLPRLLNQVAAGDTLLICKDEKPIAEIRPIEKPRPLGLAKGEVTFLAGFDDPLPPDVIEAIEAKLGTVLASRGKPAFRMGILIPSVEQSSNSLT